ncbi:hypothetical protein GCM10022223_42130 [Kineosporia mesophila]|uniref:Secreted protein n=1 Tax=Kineosporia mesophila TaxID=566012 RepID=A0ABP6ZWD4_9ACTN|nr:hypothetical protein [Kineosporia mesophila]MCD5355069.1 hypothetical protein [Kineosporia mesophila]
MFAFFSRRLRTWLLLTVAVPAVAVAARALARRIEKRNGSTKVSRALISVSNLIGRRSEKGREASAEAHSSKFSHRRH